MRHPLLTVILAALGVEGCSASPGSACLVVDDLAATCPAPDEVDRDELFTPGTCGVKVGRITQDETPEPEQRDTDLTGPRCCYEAMIVDDTPMSNCVVGRPYAEDGESRLASAELDEGPAGAWQRAALAEHASIAAFARLTLQLMAHGAPLDLLADAQAAAADEARHARLCAEVAVALGGRRLVFGPLDVGDAGRPVTLAALAAAAVAEGCFGETLAARIAEEAAVAAEHPAAAEALRAIAADEARHAALSWRIVAWALSAGGPEVRDAARAARPVLPGPTASTDAWAAAGCLGPEATRAAIARGLDDIVLPALGVLLAA